jgi:cytochrome P450
MSNYFMHTDPDVFSDPLEFKPERWMADVTPAMLFRPGGLALQLFQTDESDVVRAHDFIIALPRLDTKGVRATVR